MERKGQEFKHCYNSENGQYKFGGAKDKERIKNSGIWLNDIRNQPVLGFILRDTGKHQDKFSQIEMSRELRSLRRKKMFCGQKKKKKKNTGKSACFGPF